MPRALPLLASVAVLACGGAVALASTHRINSDEGPLPSLTGAPATGAVPAEQNCTLCHQDFDHPCSPEPCNLNAPGGGIEVLGAPAIYLPGFVYPLSVHLWSDSTLADPDPLWGFEMTTVRAIDGASSGTWENADPDSIAVLPGSGAFAGRSYVEQTYLGARPGLHGGVEWTVYWRAPMTDDGPVRLYVAGVAGNGNDEPGAGDFVYTSSVAMGSGVDPARKVSWGTLKTRYR
jgi:hypothetical protein